MIIDKGKFKRSESAEVIYKMNLHTTIKIVDDENENIFVMFITRVPGGWIYETESEPGYTATFVPYDNEFQKTFKIPDLR